MIEFINTLMTITEKNLSGFFVDWPNPPTAQMHIKILENSSYFWLAIDTSSGNVVGFINAISDKTLCAYIPLLEVLPEYKGKEIGSELVRHMLITLKDYYMVDLLCDDNLTNFYKRFDMFEARGMMLRNYKMQCGK